MKNVGFSLRPNQWFSKLKLLLTVPAVAILRDIISSRHFLTGPLLQRLANTVLSICHRKSPMTTSVFWMSEILKFVFQVIGRNNRENEKANFRMLIFKSFQSQTIHGREDKARVFRILAGSAHISVALTTFTKRNDCYMFRDGKCCTFTSRCMWSGLEQSNTICIFNTGQEGFSEYVNICKIVYFKAYRYAFVLQRKENWFIQVWMIWKPENKQPSFPRRTKRSRRF